MKTIILLASILSMVCCSLKNISEEKPITGTWVSTKTDFNFGIKEIMTITFELDKTYTRKQDVICLNKVNNNCVEKKGDTETGSFNLSGDQLILKIASSDKITFSYTYQIKGTILRLLSKSGNISTTFIKK